MPIMPITDGGNTELDGWKAEAVSRGHGDLRDRGPPVCGCQTANLRLLQCRAAQGVKVEPKQEDTTSA